MKIVLAEVPYTKDRDISVEKSCVPEGAELTMAVFDEHAENNDAFYAAIKDADIIIDGYVHFGKKEIDAMDHCKVISFQSTGYNEADLDYAKEKGIAVCSILDYCTQETAESAMALMLNLQRGIRQYDRSVQQDHVWDYQVVPGLKRIAGQVMGIAGLGRIGQSVAPQGAGVRHEGHRLRPVPAARHCREPRRQARRFRHAAGRVRRAEPAHEPHRGELPHVQQGSVHEVQEAPHHRQRRPRPADLSTRISSGRSTTATSAAPRSTWSRARTRI